MGVYVVKLGVHVWKLGVQISVPYYKARYVFIRKEADSRSYSSQAPLKPSTSIVNYRPPINQLKLTSKR